jgi:hypothetical protein
MTNKRYRNHVKNVRQRIPCNSCKWLISRKLIGVFLFHNQFWFLVAYLVGLVQRICQLIVTNLRHLKLLVKSLVTSNMTKVISLKVRILRSNFLLTLLSHFVHQLKLFSTDILKPKSSGRLSLIISVPIFSNSTRLTCLPNFCRYYGGQKILALTFLTFK